MPANVTILRWVGDTLSPARIRASASPSRVITSGPSARLLARSHLQPSQYTRSIVTGAMASPEGVPSLPFRIAQPPSPVQPAGRSKLTRARPPGKGRPLAPRVSPGWIVVPW